MPQDAARARWLWHVGVRRVDVAPRKWHNACTRGVSSARQSSRLLSGESVVRIHHASPLLVPRRRAPGRWLAARAGRPTASWGATWSDARGPGSGDRRDAGGGPALPRRLRPPRRGRRHGRHDRGLRLREHVAGAGRGAPRRARPPCDASGSGSSGRLRPPRSRPRRCSRAAPGASCGGCYRWRNADGSAGHVRGVDVLRVRDGKVVEKLSYVKG